jgi:hypothetical protein
MTVLMPCALLSIIPVMLLSYHEQPLTFYLSDGIRPLYRCSGRNGKRWTGARRKVTLQRNPVKEMQKVAFSTGISFHFALIPDLGPR